MNNRENDIKISIAPTLSLGTIGFITWVVFLVLKLCNENNPDFTWLTWFWVWFPLWLPLAIAGACVLLVTMGVLIYLLMSLVTDRW